MTMSLQQHKNYVIGTLEAEQELIGDGYSTSWFSWKYLNMLKILVKQASTTDEVRTIYQHYIQQDKQL